jgi:hypothetical protein
MTTGYQLKFELKKTFSGIQRREQMEQLIEPGEMSNISPLINYPLCITSFESHAGTQNAPWATQECHWDQQPDGSAKLNDSGVQYLRHCLRGNFVDHNNTTS